MRTLLLALLVVGLPNAAAAGTIRPAKRRPKRDPPAPSASTPFVTVLEASAAATATRAAAGSSWPRAAISAAATDAA